MAYYLVGTGRKSILLNNPPHHSVDDFKTMTEAAEIPITAMSGSVGRSKAIQKRNT
jgi:hypothetical protein